MERITPPTVEAYMLRRGKLTIKESVSELGIFSSVFIDTTRDDPVIDNKTIGLLHRTKGVESDEGGINTGFSVIDQPYLVEWKGESRLEPLLNF